MPIVEYPNGEAFYQSPMAQGCYPTHVFPPIIGEAIWEVSQILTLPVELSAQAALGTVSHVCQDFISVQCPNFDPAPCSLFLMGVSNSSAGKSPVEQRFLRAVVARERQQEEDVAAKMPIYLAELKIWQDDERRLAKDYRSAEPASDEALSIREMRLQHEQQRPVKPAVREQRYAELSPQGLRDALVANGTISIISAEAGPVINGMTFGQPAMFSGYWSGEDRPVGLVSGNRRPVAPQLTISVMSQTDRFSDYMESRGRDAFGTGMLARTLIVAPQYSDVSGQETCVEDVPEPKLGLFNERVKQILGQVVPAPRERTVKRLSEGAKRYWKLFKDAINRWLVGSCHSDSIKFFFRKLAQNASRIAALFHYFEGKPGDISPEAMKSAIALCEWYADEYIRVFTPYAPSKLQQEAEAMQKLLEWLQEAAANPFRYSQLKPGQYTERDLNNFSPIRKNPALLASAIDALQRQGYISIVPGRKGGRIILFPANKFAEIMPDFHATHPRMIAARVKKAIADMGESNFGAVVSAKQGTYVVRANDKMVHTAAQAGDPKHVVHDSKDFRAVKQEIQKQAGEAGLGHVELTSTYYYRD
ncbi:hypothetical protein PI87_02950 [Ralstonia sp. A12]|uniref:DUF3987 domain-containing protein n=1 Tax=Ralstonia sp. A12 TaxID=1217052 RepID=UPI000573DC19|nr:DUF3987 domain-containing protein [Ralstonia sp. A12]KHK58707.1 hypothetical protein PI87_02950 [Ralstonia sp. A12]